MAGESANIAVELRLIPLLYGRRMGRLWIRESNAGFLHFPTLKEETFTRWRIVMQVADYWLCGGWNGLGDTEFFEHSARHLGV